MHLYGVRVVLAFEQIPRYQLMDKKQLSHFKLTRIPFYSIPHKARHIEQIFCLRVRNSKRRPSLNSVIFKLPHV